MKKVLMIAAAAAFVLGAGVMAPANASAKSFSVKKCKACHAVGKKKVGPAWKDVAAAYGDADTLAKVFKDGFKVNDRKVSDTCKDSLIRRSGQRPVTDWC